MFISLLTNSDAVDGETPMILATGISRPVAKYMAGASLGWKSSERTRARLYHRGCACGVMLKRDPRSSSRIGLPNKVAGLNHPGMRMRRGELGPVSFRVFSSPFLTSAHTGVRVGEASFNYKFLHAIV